MARPSVKAERTEEILDAFERCVARFGVEGTSLERIAEESGLRRSLLRYYIGNRDELVEALADRYIQKADYYMDALIASLPESNPAKSLVEGFFADSKTFDENSVSVASALITCSSSYAKVKEMLRDWYDRFVSSVCKVIEANYPGAGHDRCWMIALSIISIYFNVDSMEPLGLDERYRQSSIDAIHLLLGTLSI